MSCEQFPLGGQTKPARSNRTERLAYSLIEAGEALGLSPKNTREFLEAHDIPVIKSGRRILVSVALLRQALGETLQEKRETLAREIEAVDRELRQLDTGMEG